MSTYTGVSNFKNSPVFWPTLYLSCSKTDRIQRFRCSFASNRSRYVQYIGN